MAYEQSGYNERGGTVWNHSNASQEDRSATAMLRDTEDEVFAAAFDDIGWENDPATAGSAQVDDRADSDALIEQQSQITGFSGEPLGLDEIAAVNLYGHGSTDRPVESETVEELQQELAAERSTVARLTNGGVDEIPMLIDRQRYEAREQAKKQMIDQGMYMDVAGKEDEFLNHQEAQNLISQLKDGKIKYGAEFDEAYEALTNLNPHNPRHRATARTICFSNYGGSHVADTLVHWYRGQQQGGRSQQRQSNQQSRGPSWEDQLSGADGVSSAADEADIFASAFRD